MLVTAGRITVICIRKSSRIVLSVLLAAVLFSLALTGIPRITVAAGSNSGTPPVIYGPCGMTFTFAVGESETVQFYASDPDPGDDLDWSIQSVNPCCPSGSYGISSSGILRFTPGISDEGIIYIFAIRVTDLEGNYDECAVSLEVMSTEWFEITIAKIDSQQQGVHAYVQVTKTLGTEEIWGWDFLTGYDQSALSFVTADPGPLFDIPGSYEWEYFTFRYEWGDDCGPGCPTARVRTVAMADAHDGTGHRPKEVVVESGTTLFTLDFVVSTDRRFECQFIPIDFYWMDCGDNILAYRSRGVADWDILTAVSEHVYRYGEEDVSFPYYEVTDNSTGFPTYTGVQDSCLEQDDPHRPDPKPLISFFGGGIEIVCAGDIAARGDVNLNGIANEVADAVMFINYFLYDLAAFPINTGGQSAATDVNQDGITLSVADLVYLIRVILEDALPLDKMDLNPSPAKTIATRDAIRIEADVGAAYFVFEGKVEVAQGSGATAMDIVHYFNGTQTSVLVYAIADGRYASGEILRTSGKLLYAEAADYYGQPYDLRLQQLQPRRFTVRNYPNPFNSTAIIELSLPTTGNYTVDIFDMLGQKVASFSGRGTADEICRIEWDASELSSGIYYCRAEACGFTAVGKMMLLR
jgi:hypothetical protein